MTEIEMSEVQIPQDYKNKMEKYIEERPGAYKSVDELFAEAIRVHMFDLNTRAKLDLTFVDGVNLTNDVYRELLKKWLHDSEFENARSCIEDEAYEILTNDVLLDGYYAERTKHLYKKFNIKIE